MNLNLLCPINNLGYGIHSFNMLKALKDNDVNISLAVYGQPDISDKIVSDYVHGCTPGLNPENYTLHIFHDAHLPVDKMKKLIAFSVFETSRLKQDVIDKLNQVDFIFTTTEEHRKLLKVNGVTKDIHVVNEGVDPEIFNMDEVVPLLDTGKYTFMLLGKNEKRKNTGMAITSFIESMHSNNVALICHTYSPFIKDSQKLTNWTEIDISLFGYVLDTENELYIKYTNNTSDIYFTKPGIPTDKMKNLYHSANVGISFSSAEGWGLPETELMACGVPMIITNVIGHREYITNLPVFRELIINPTEVELANDGKFFHGDVGIWAKFKSEDLQEKLEYAYTNGIGNEKSKELSDYITTRYNWNNSAIEVKRIINRVQNEN